MDFELNVLPTMAVTLAIASLISGGNRQWFGNPIVLSGKQYATRNLIMTVVLLGTLLSFFGGDLAKMILEQKYLILAVAASSVSVDHCYGFSDRDNKLIAQYTSSAQALSNLQSQQPVLHVHLDEAQEKADPSMRSQSGVKGWIRKHTRRIAIITGVLLVALGIGAGLFFFYSSLFKPVPWYKTLVGQLIIGFCTTGFICTVMIVRLIISERQLAMASLREKSESKVNSKKLSSRISQIEVSDGDLYEEPKEQVHERFHKYKMYVC